MSAGLYTSAPPAPTETSMVFKLLADADGAAEDELEDGELPYWALTKAGRRYTAVKAIENFMVRE